MSEVPTEVPTASSSPTGFELLGEEFLPPPKVSQLIEKTERTLEWWRETQQGPPYLHVGKTILYRKSALLKWLVDQEVLPRRSRKGGAR